LIDRTFESYLALELILNDSKGALPVNPRLDIIPSLITFTYLSSALKVTGF
jgi:hypothetical protein